MGVCLTSFNLYVILLWMTIQMVPEVPIHLYSGIRLELCLSCIKLALGPGWVFFSLTKNQMQQSC